MATKITIETCYNKVSVEVPDDDLNFAELINTLFVPAVLGIGYQPGTIKDFVDTDAI